MSTYQPNDSEFGETYASWLAAGDFRGSVLEGFPVVTLDEYASCARSLLGVPAYAEDIHLQEFTSQLEERRDDIASEEAAIAAREREYRLPSFGSDR